MKRKFNIWNNSIHVIFISIFFIIACFISLNSCKKESSDNTTVVAPKPFQGPLNPSFEEATADWKVGGSDVARTTNTSFMPTKGSWYMDLAPFTTNNWYSAFAYIYQENVDFSLSHTLTFDYSLSGYGAKEFVAILFTANGTDTLWSKSFSGIQIPTTKKLNETITLPSLPDKGKLTIQTYAEGGQNTVFDFQIDNIRVQ